MKSQTSGKFDPKVQPQEASMLPPDVAEAIAEILAKALVAEICNPVSARKFEPQA